MKLRIHRYADYLTDKIRSIAPEFRNVTTEDVIDLILHYNPDYNMQLIMESNLVYLIRTCYASSISNHIAHLLWGEIGKVLPSEDFNAIEYNSYQITLIGGYYESTSTA